MVLRPANVVLNLRILLPSKQCLESIAFMTLGILRYWVSALKSSLNYFLDSSLAALTSVALFGLSTIHPDFVT